MSTQQSTAIDFKAMAKELRGHAAAVGMESLRLTESGHHDHVDNLGDIAFKIGSAARQLEAWRLAEAKELASSIGTLNTMGECLGDTRLQDEIGLTADERALFRQLSRMALVMATVMQAKARQLDHDGDYPSDEAKRADRRRVCTITTAAVLDTLQGLDLHQAGLMRLAESLAHAGLKEGDTEQVHQHAIALEGLREDLALSVPEPLE
ncbi:hypothetical protein [Halomonas sp.]|uniref:hypothetical protein n=1 Tax=Halomonas sp. TaxID=1486246 RepID=UPI003D14C748